MTYNDAKVLLSFIWGMFPHAPKLNNDDKQVTVYSYWELLKEFSLDDAIRATKECIKDKSSFVPTAPEILKKCSISEEYINSFLPAEVWQLRDELNAEKTDVFFSDDLEVEIINLERWLGRSDHNDDYLKHVRKCLEIDKKKLELENRLNEIIASAEKTARETYKNNQIMQIQAENHKALL